MNKKQHEFGRLSLLLTEGAKANVGISRSSNVLSQIIHGLEGKRVLDQGCGVGYMAIGALLMGAKKVVATDITDTEDIVRKNLTLNSIKQEKLDFMVSNLFESLPLTEKFDVMIANLPQHALPAIPAAKKLEGKYGGFDGTDLVCQSLSEASYYLNPGGRYFGSISELTNFKRTLSIAKSLYDIRIHLKQTKTLRIGEMHPFITDSMLMEHLQQLRSEGLILYSGDLSEHRQVTYNVLFCEFIKK